QAASGQQFVFYERNVRLNARRIAIHQESNRASGRQYRYLRIPKTEPASLFQGGIPAFARLLLQVMKFLAGLDGFHRLAMLPDHAEHGIDVVSGFWFGYVGAT